MIGEQTTISILVGIRFGFQNGNHYNLNYLYNFLNLISEVKQGTTVKANYKWSATGAKLSVRDGAGTNGYDYMGSIVYKKNGATTDVDVINFSSGVIRKQSGSYMVNYFINDHLGSTRMIVDGSGTVKEKNDYYPFGARHKRSDYIASDNRYKYNGKEEQTTGDVGFIDYGARMYDSRIGRWNSIDPLAGFYSSYSPFNYALNNPIMFIDPNGMFVGNYYDRYGNYLGWDGIDDNKDYLVENNNDVKIIKKNNKKNGTTSVKDVSSAKELVSRTSLQEGLAVLDRTIANGGLSEEASLVMKDGSIVKGEKGPQYESGIYATVDMPSVPKGKKMKMSKSAYILILQKY